MTLAELKAAIAGLPDNTEVLIANPEWGPCPLANIYFPGENSHHECSPEQRAQVATRLLLED